MRALALALVMLLPSAVEAQVVEVGKTVSIWPATPGPALRAIWNNVVICAGTAYVPTKTFDQIVWYIREPMTDEAGDSLLGEWVNDTIYITQGYEKSGWVAAHEMLHHALNGPPEGDPHPYVPFAFPCGLNQFQQKAGGIMGGVELPNAKWPAVILYRREE